MKDRILVAIDVENIAHRSYHALKKTPIRDPVVYGVLASLRNLSIVFDTTQFAFCFDGGESLRREELPGYKSNRDLGSSGRGIISTDVYRLRTKILKSLGLSNVFWHPGYEADDLIGFLAQRQEPLVIVSSDRDFWQLLDGDRVRIWDPAKKTLFTEEDLWQHMMASPEDYLMVKAICGCDSDCVPGVPGVGQISAMRWIRNELTLDSSYRHKIESNLHLIDRNFRLIQLPYGRLERPDLRIRKSTTDKDSRWNNIVERLGLPQLQGCNPR